MSLNKKSPKGRKSSNAIAELVQQGKANGSMKEIKEGAAFAADAALSPCRRWVSVIASPIVVGTNRVRNVAATATAVNVEGSKGAQQFEASQESEGSQGSQGSQAEWKGYDGKGYRLVPVRVDDSSGNSKVRIFVDTDECFYFAKSSTGKSAYVYCIEEKCKVHGIIKSDGTEKGGIFQYALGVDASGHQHSNHCYELALSDAYNDLKCQVLSSKQTVHDIFRAWLRNQDDDDVIIEYPWVSVKTTMNRLRQSMFPLCLDQATFIRLLETHHEVKEKFGTFKCTDFFQAGITSPGGTGTTALFVNEKVLEKISPGQKSNWFMDATFKIQPLGYRQLFIGLVEIEGTPHATFYALMNGSAENDYVGVFGWLKCYHGIDVGKVKVDFELATMNAVTVVWPDAKVECCYFHFCQALRRNIISKVKDYKGLRQRRIAELYKKLPMLPLDKIDEALVMIENLQKKLGVLRDFKEFNAYFRATWIARFPPEIWCVYDLDCRTNNNCETYNNGIKVYTKYGQSPLKFLDNLQNMAHEAYSKLLYRLNKAKKGIAAPESKSVYKEVIAKYLPLLVAGKITILQCLEGLISKNIEFGPDFDSGTSDEEE